LFYKCITYKYFKKDKGYCKQAVNAIQNIEEKRIVRLEERMDGFDMWRQELKGSWKVIAAMMAAAATIGGLIAKYLFK